MLAHSVGCLGGRVASSCLMRNGAHRSLASSSVTRIGVEDPRMSRIVIHNGTVYISGQTDTTASDSMYERRDKSVLIVTSKN